MCNVWNGYYLQSILAIVALLVTFESTSAQTRFVNKSNSQPVYTAKAIITQENSVSPSDRRSPVSPKTDELKFPQESEINPIDLLGTRGARQNPQDESDNESDDESENESDDDPKRAPYNANQVETFKSITDISIDIREPSTVVPQNRPLMIISSAMYGPKKEWSNRVVTWHAPNIKYQPLYFEQVPTERYGQTFSPGVQSAVNAAHFFKNMVTLPHKWLRQHPKECVYPIGYCQPGTQVPFTRERIFGQ